jgi:hypothetical protein
MSAIHTKTARQKALCGNHSYSNMSWPSQRSLNSADTETKEDTREKSKEIKEQEKIEAFVKKLLLRMRLRRWALIPRNIDEALARNSLCSMLDIAFEDLMPLLLACELVEYEKKGRLQQPVQSQFKEMAFLHGKTAKSHSVLHDASTS